MFRNHPRLLGALAAAACLAGGFEARGVDHFRRLGIGYGAGYHAPAPFTQSPTLDRLPGWAGWKAECCLPGGNPLATGCRECGAVAPPAAPCTTCGPQPPPVARGCGCGTRAPRGCGLPPRTFPRPGPGLH